jgi:hypothetical protein
MFFLMPPTLAIAQAEAFDCQWSPENHWQINRAEF